MITALVIVLVAGICTYGGYKWGTHDTLAATEWVQTNVDAAAEAMND